VKDLGRVFGVLCICAIGCGRAFDVVLLNSSNEVVRQAHVSFDDFRSVGGVLAPNAEAVHGGVELEVPNFAEFVWVDASGLSHDVRLRVPPRPSGRNRLVFEIRSSGKTIVYWQ
jgi:hypothetical protein